MQIYTILERNFLKNEKHRIGAVKIWVPNIFAWHPDTSKSTQFGAIWHHLETLGESEAAKNKRKIPLKFVQSLPD